MSNHSSRLLSDKQKGTPIRRAHSRRGGLLGSKCQLVNIDGVRGDLFISIDLIIDGDAVPACLGWVVVAVQSCRLAIEADGVEQQLASGRPLHIQGQVVPGIADRITRYAAWNPVLCGVVPRVPFMAPRNAA